MGTTQDNTIYTNCIKQKVAPGYYRQFEQFDEYGNVIYLYKQERANRDNNINELLKVNVHNSEGRIIGTIIKEVIGCNDFRFSFYDENNQLVKYIEEVTNSCTYISYLFYDKYKNFESRVTLSGKCIDNYLEEFDQFDTRISHAIFNPCGENFYFEYDEENNLIYKNTRHFFVQVPNIIIKIYDTNNQEINIANKTLFNNGFTKIQMFLIIGTIMVPPRSD